MATRYFSLDEAQALVPRVRSLLGQALQLHGHLRVAIARLSQAGHEVTWAMLRGDDPLYASPPDAGDGDDERDDDDAIADDDLDADVAPVRDPRAEQSLERARMIYMTLRESVTQIEALGVEVKGVVEGLIDFHSWCDGEREVLLCWKLGESEIGYFHWPDEGFSGRQPISGHRFTATREHQPELNEH